MDANLAVVLGLPEEATCFPRSTLVSLVSSGRVDGSIFLHPFSALYLKGGHRLVVLSFSELQAHYQLILKRMVSECTRLVTVSWFQMI
eukprot:m.208932 g.208932  ORF g.208932 m.208932 type:complete len:88 (-) comp15043_c4_seq32:1718-1981(-)